MVELVWKMPLGTPRLMDPLISPTIYSVVPVVGVETPMGEEPVVERWNFLPMGMVCSPSLPEEKSRQWGGYFHTAFPKRWSRFRWSDPPRRRKHIDCRHPGSQGWQRSDRHSWWRWAALRLRPMATLPWVQPNWTGIPRAPCISPEPPQPVRSIYPRERLPLIRLMATGTTPVACMERE